MLGDLFGEAAATQTAFNDQWQDLVKYLETGLNGLVMPPYRVQAGLTCDHKLDISLNVRLCRGETVPGQTEPAWKTLRERTFYNLNYAGTLPFGQAYRTLFGRDLALSEPASGPLPLHVVLKPGEMDCARSIFYRWVNEGIEADIANPHKARPQIWLAADNRDLPQGPRLRGP